MKRCPDCRSELGHDVPRCRACRRPMCPECWNREGELCDHCFDVIWEGSVPNAPGGSTAGRVPVAQGV